MAEPYLLMVAIRLPTNYRNRSKIEVRLFGKPIPVQRGRSSSSQKLPLTVRKDGRMIKLIESPFLTSTIQLVAAFIGGSHQQNYSK